MKYVKKEFSGKMILDDNNDYILDFKNLSSLLNSIYMQNFIDWINITIEDATGFKVVADGELHLRRNKYDIYDWYVGEFDLGTYLFDHTEENLKIIVSTKEESES